MAPLKTKILDIRTNIVPTTTVIPNIAEHPACPILLSNFQQVSLPELIDTVSHMHSSSSPLDILPTSFLHEAVGTVGPSLLRIMNCSLSSGPVPDNFNKVRIQPLLKKPNLDQSLRAGVTRRQKYINT